MLEKRTETYRTANIPLQADIYTSASHSKTTPVLLYFHPGGLTSWGRDSIPPWLVQACYLREWPVISPSYRLLPQVEASGLLDDVLAAYEFASKYNTAAGTHRRVIVAGASAAFSLATLTAHHHQSRMPQLPSPLALLSNAGIPSYHHPFFHSSTQLTPEPLADSTFAGVMAPGDPIVGPLGGEGTFETNMLTPSGGKNTTYQPDSAKPTDAANAEREGLYDYLLYKNMYPKLLSSIDPDFASFTEAQVAAWPKTVIYHGDDDPDVPLSLSEWLKEQLGQKVELKIIRGKDHLFDLASFVEDEGEAMDELRGIFDDLDEVVAVVA